MVFKIVPLIAFSMALAHASQVAEPVQNMKPSVKKGSSFKDPCEEVLVTLSMRKREFMKRVSDAAEVSADQCFEVVKEEAETPMSVPASCQYKKVKDLPKEFRNELADFDGRAPDPEEKVNKLIAQVRDNLHDMLQGKCESRGRSELDGASRDEKEAFEAKAAKTRRSGTSGGGVAR